MDGKGMHKVSFIHVVSKPVYGCADRQRIYHGTVIGRG
jgi:hypothetical protein